ncbi:MAG: hypothetical protein IJT83_13375 [Victivallales bacterium]|nr:hypothetical protein [Victivallales bacterium]
MASQDIKCEQLWEGDSLQMAYGSSKALSATRHFSVKGADLEEDALVALHDYLKKEKLDSYLKMGLSTLQVQERLAPDLWRIDAIYKGASIDSSGSDDEPKETTSYAMSTTTMHITHSRKTVRSYAVDGKAPDYKGAMCVRNGEAQGTDINFSTVNFTITHYFKKTNWSTALRNKILNNGNKMNKEPFRGFDAGEVLYLTATIEPVTEGGTDYLKVDYQFAYSPNDDDVELSGWQGKNIKKEGWNFMWVQDKTDPDDGIPVPESVHIEQVYKTLDFTSLGLKAKE